MSFKVYEKKVGLVIELCNYITKKSLKVIVLLLLCDMKNMQ